MLGSLQKIAMYMLGHKMDKSETMSHWGKRPLTESQRRYAVYDVLVAIDIYRALERDLGPEMRRRFEQSW